MASVVAAAASANAEQQHRHAHKSRQRSSSVLNVNDKMPAKAAIIRELPVVFRQTISVAGALWAKRRIALTQDFCFFCAVGSDITVCCLILQTSAITA